MFPLLPSLFFLHLRSFSRREVYNVAEQMPRPMREVEQTRTPINIRLQILESDAMAEMRVFCLHMPSICMHVVTSSL